MTQLILNIENSQDATLIKKLLAKFDGVTVIRRSSTRKKTNSATKQILADQEMMASIARGERDLAEGRFKQMTAAQVGDLLGV